MSDVVIEVENLSKMFYIGASQAEQTSLRTALKQTATAPIERIKRLFRGEGGAGRAISLEEPFWALQDINFRVKQGEVLGVIGHNGAGKSTLLKILSRITPPSTGVARIHGRVGSLLEVGTGFHPELTGRSNIFLNGAVLGMGRQEIIRKFDEIVAFAEVEQFIDTPVKFYSSGMYMRLAFAVAAHLETEILLIDEVLAVGDASFQQKCLAKMDDVTTNEGRTILFVSHFPGAIKALCNRVILLENGYLKMQGTPDEVVDFYLGEIAAPVTEVHIPEDPSIRVQITNAAIEPIYLPDGEEGMLFKCTYHAKQQLDNLLLCVEVFDSRDISIYYSNNDYLSDPRKRQLGTHTVSLVIPSYLFRPGEYKVAFGFWEPGFDYAEHFPEARLKFSRAEPMSRLSRHGVAWPSAIYKPDGWNYLNGSANGVEAPSHEHA
ncbi:MAG: ATP-binding cassette domain-containing protein [Chloroflexi bacterium]|nr:ATP-binding cassette domain-containing protein [Chloroflexota bacterium]